jgi:hypothetical protein
MCLVSTTLSAARLLWFALVEGQWKVKLKFQSDDYLVALNPSLN